MFHDMHREGDLMQLRFPNPLRPDGVIGVTGPSGGVEGVTGVLMGRASGPNANKPEQLTTEEALLAVLGDLGVPVIHDADLGHMPPQMTLVNGAHADVWCADGKGKILQTFS